ncbi:MAG: imidazoleglycerol-phosphate dehydratase HisB [Chloroflexi bacterium]|nr:imidazoleglycerol-phosphate dehydratase HisB [Chloroflexota bacterium]
MPDAARRARVKRETKETTIEVEIAIDGTGQAEVATGVGFLDHLLDGFARHGVFDLKVKAAGDLHIDEHHTVEDVAIALGRAINQALGDRRGIRRMGHAYAPLDEALALVVVDVSGRGYSVIEAEFGPHRLGQLDPDLVRHFVETVARDARCTVHASVLRGHNDHHKAEALFKALARALDQATQFDERLGGSVPSTKGTLTS